MNMTEMRPNLAQYRPSNLFDELRAMMKLKNDRALSRILEIEPSVISKIRHHRSPVGGAVLIRMHEVCGLSISELRHLMGDRRKRFRVNDAQGKPKLRKPL